MKIILDCSNLCRNIIRRNLANDFECLDYTDEVTIMPSYLLIKEINTLEDVTSCQMLHFCNVAFIIKNGKYMFELLQFKPILFLRYDQLDNDLDELIKRVSLFTKEKELMIDFHCGYQHIRLNIHSIIYIESNAHYLLIHTINSTVKVREKLSLVKEKLASLGFIQVHRSYLINNSYITKITTNELIMSNGDCIPIGKKYHDQIIELCKK